MKKQLILCSLFLFISAVLSYGQCVGSCTTVSGTITDSSAQVWSLATVTTQIVPPFGKPGPLLNNGVPINAPVTTLNANGSGVFSVSLDDNNVVTPSGSQWRITVCPNATVSNCNVFLLTITGASMNISSQITANISVPFVNTAPTIFRAYSDTEANGGQGATYWNVISNTLRGCTITPCPPNWVGIGSGGGGSGTVTSVTAGTGITLTPNPITTTGTVAEATTGVSAGSYTSANITVTAQGTISAASNGSGGSGISCSGTCSSTNIPVFNGASTVDNSGLSETGGVLSILDSTITMDTTAGPASNIVIQNTAAKNNNINITLAGINNNTTNGAGVTLTSASNLTGSAGSSSVFVGGGLSGGGGGPITITSGSSGTSSGGTITVAAGSGAGFGGPGSILLEPSGNGGSFGYGVVQIGSNNVSQPGILRIMPSAGNTPVQLVVNSGGSSYYLALPNQPPTGSNQTLSVTGSSSIYGNTTWSSTWQPAVNTGVIQYATVAGCTSSGSPCNVTITWPVAFIDNAYLAVCSPVGPVTGQPQPAFLYTGTQTASTVIVTIDNRGTTNPGGYSQVNCSAQHP